LTGICAAQVIGRLSAAAFAARATVLAAADELAVTLDGHHNEPERLDASELAAAQAQVIVTKLVLDATSELFEVGGASLTSEKLAIDRHWRNARTIASHNPAIARERLLGDHFLNGINPREEWAARWKKAEKKDESAPLQQETDQ